MSHQAFKWTRQHRSYPTATQQSAFEPSSFFANKSPGRVRPSEKPSPGASSFLLSPFPEGKGSRRNGDPPKSQQCLLGPHIKRRNGEGLEGSSLPGTAELSCHRSSGMTCRADPGRMAGERLLSGLALLHHSKDSPQHQRGEKRELGGDADHHAWLLWAAAALQHAPTSTEPHALEQLLAEQGGRVRW